MSFYRATLCVSAVFAVVRCPSARPSGRLSVYHVGALYIHTAEDIVKLISRPDYIALHYSYLDWPKVKNC